METAIKRAIEGGWKPRYWTIDGDMLTDVSHASQSEKMLFLFEPQFWQSLGKAEGWKDYLVVQDFWCEECRDWENKGASGWKVQMHRFIDAIISGKSPDSFFEELLSKQ